MFRNAWKTAPLRVSQVYRLDWTGSILLSVAYIRSGISAAINKYLCCVDSQKLYFFFSRHLLWAMQFKVFQKEELSAGFVEDYF